MARLLPLARMAIVVHVVLMVIAAVYAHHKVQNQIQRPGLALVSRLAVNRSQIGYNNNVGRD